MSADSREGRWPGKGPEGIARNEPERLETTFDAGA